MPFSEPIPVLTPGGRDDNALSSYARSYSQPAEVLSFVGKSVVVGTQCTPQCTPFAPDCWSLCRRLLCCGGNPCTVGRDASVVVLLVPLLLPYQSRP